jgi:hypothetical protein
LQKLWSSYFARSCVLCKLWRLVYQCVDIAVAGTSTVDIGCQVDIAVAGTSTINISAVAGTSTADTSGAIRLSKAITTAKATKAI